MTGTDTRSQAASTLTPPHARPVRRRSAAGAGGPAVSFLPALTTNIHGSGAAVSFPHGYPVMLVVTVVVTAVAGSLGALVAGRAALVAIPLGLALLLIIGFAVTIAGAMLAHHAHLTGWGIAFLAAVAAGAATGLPLAARR
jgi:hypothetical protein